MSAFFISIQVWQHVLFYIFLFHIKSRILELMSCTHKIHQKWLKYNTSLNAQGQRLFLALTLITTRSQAHCLVKQCGD